jgi:hypothetical protein
MQRLTKRKEVAVAFNVSRTHNATDELKNCKRKKRNKKKAEGEGGVGKWKANDPKMKEVKSQAKTESEGLQ